MHDTWLGRIGAGIAVAGAVLIATGGTAAAQGDMTTVDLRQSDVTADDPEFDQGFGNCEEKPDQLPNEDIWVFVWPGMPGSVELVSLTLNFDTDGDGIADETRTEDDATQTTDEGALKVWVTTPAGWTLVDGTSEVTASNPPDMFNLTHSCAGVPIPPTATPTPSASPTPSPTVAPSPSVSPSVAPSGTPGPTGTPAPPPSMAPVLPVTGGGWGAPVLLGVALLGAGGGLLLALRRRRASTDPVEG